MKEKFVINLKSDDIKMADSRKEKVRIAKEKILELEAQLTELRKIVYDDREINRRIAKKKKELDILEDSITVAEYRQKIKRIKQKKIK